MHFIVTLSPLLLVASVAAFASGGRIFRTEPRISRGRTFRLLKFATTKPDSDELTWAGRRLLRPWYLDELPQLFNILRGDMSFVGPRAWPPSMVERQVAEGLDYRLRTMAGLIGEAQATKGVAGTRYVDLDLHYVAQCRALGGLALVRYDFGIIARSLRVLARGEGLTY